MTRQMFNLGSVKSKWKQSSLHKVNKIKLVIILSASQNEEIIKIKIFIS